MSKKITVDPVLRLLESNHDFCDTKKEIKPSLQNYASVNSKHQHPPRATPGVLHSTAAPGPGFILDDLPQGPGFCISIKLRLVH